MMINVTDFRSYLENEEKAAATVAKYSRDVSAFAEWLGERELEKGLVNEYKRQLIGRFKPASVNAAIASLNKYFIFIKRPELRLKSVRVQRSTYLDRERELTRADYNKLLAAAEEGGRIYHVVQTLFATGIRISELRHITVEALKKRRAVIDCKGKVREIILPEKLCKALTKYIKRRGIQSGSVFITCHGNTVDTSNLSKELKRLAQKAGVDGRKVFPHNIRHLFARIYYGMYKDIVRLSEILGHSSIETTKIYTRETSDVQERRLERMRLIA